MVDSTRVSSQRQESSPEDRECPLRRVAALLRASRAGRCSCSWRQRTICEPAHINISTCDTGVPLTVRQAVRRCYLGRREDARLMVLSGGDGRVYWTADDLGSGGDGGAGRGTRLEPV